MSKLDEAKNNADIYLEEIDIAIEINGLFKPIIVIKASTLLDAFKTDRQAKSMIQSALRHKTFDMSILYKSLVVQINGVFENYIRETVKAVIEERFETVEEYRNHEENFRKNHIHRAAEILRHIKSGVVMGSAYNFEDLLNNLGKGLSGQPGYKLNPEIFTKLMGNCTAQRLENLFSEIMLPEPFSVALGANAELRKFFEQQSKARAAASARKELEDQIDLRNDIVHGNLTRALNLDELKRSLGFFRALISAFDELVRMPKGTEALSQ